MFLNFPIIALCTELSVLLGNSKQNIQNHGVFDKKKNEYAELCHVVNFECTGWQ